MSDCSGYGFGAKVNLCLAGAVGNGAETTLSITIEDFIKNHFTSSPVHVNNWDGNEIRVELTSILSSSGFKRVNCSDDVEAWLTIIPTSNDSGNLLLEFIFNNCSAGGTSDYPQIFDNCGGAGPHRISQISTFTLTNASCVA